MILYYGPLNNSLRVLEESSKFLDSLCENISYAAPVHFVTCTCNKVFFSMILTELNTLKNLLFDKWKICVPTSLKELFWTDQNKIER